MQTRRFFLVSSLAMAVATPSRSQSVPTVHVEQAWARASAGQARTGAAYMTLVNHGQAADRLVKVTGTVADKVELHTHVMDGDVMRMRLIATIEVSPGEPSVLKPGGLHVMLIGLKAPLKAGESFALDLIFEKAGTIPVKVAIGAVGAREPAAHSHKGHGS
ncbi:MAG: copper chaperone PCu(A)C [Alphaproteobacteria bacterium]|nr:copper chaperone PCu(A)C [Alphaproteobacteria bacterium]